MTPEPAESRRGQGVIIRADVEIGAGSDIGDYVIVGEPFGAAGETRFAPTRIGQRALIRSHTVIYSGNTIGDDFRSGHGVLIREHNSIGNAVSIGTHSIVEHHVVIGHSVRIHSNAFVPEYSVLEDGCWIGPGAILTNARYPLSPSAKRELRGPRICAVAKVGAGAVLLPGVVVGADAIVGAGAVVVRDVPTAMLVVGNPSRILRSVRDIDAYTAPAT